MDDTDRQFADETVDFDNATGGELADVPQTGVVKGLRAIYVQNQQIIKLLKSPQQTSGGTVEMQGAMMCKEHGLAMEKGLSKTKFKADGTPKSYWFHRVNGAMCFGEGVRS
jgi:hypothetical protein